MLAYKVPQTKPFLASCFATIYYGQLKVGEFTHKHGCVLNHLDESFNLSNMDPVQRKILTQNSMDRFDQSIYVFMYVLRSLLAFGRVI
jgi:hypothetical protein